MYINKYINKYIYIYVYMIYFQAHDIWVWLKILVYPN